MLVILSVVNLVLLVPAQFPNMLAINQNNVQQLQSLVLQNLQKTLQDMNNMATGMTGNPAMQKLFTINSNHQLQNTQNPRSSNLYSTSVQGSDFGSAHLNVPWLSNYPNIQLSMGTIAPHNPGHDNSMTFNRPPAFFQGNLYHGMPKTWMFMGNPFKNQPFNPPPPTTTTLISTFAPEYVTPAPVVNEENNGNKNKINDNDENYDIDVRYQ